jgi:hypothetical protein
VGAARRDALAYSLSAARAERLKAEAAALPKQEIVPFNFDWQAVQAGL